MLSDDDFLHLLNYLDRPWDGFRKVRKGVKKRLRRHMEILNCIQLADYLRKIELDPTIRAVCEQQLIVTISRFFRDRRLWEILSHRHLPALIERFPKDLCVWSAGCANGEEPYSLSILWEELQASISALPCMQIIATDADPACLHRAKNGIYPASSLKEIPEELKKRWFEKIHGGKQMRIRDAVRARIHWRHHQLMDAPPEGGFQLIFLRNNLLTYYQGSRRDAAFANIILQLAKGGTLVIGSHERVPSLGLPLQRDENCPWVYVKVR